MIAEAGFHADACVVEGDGVATDETKETRADRTRETAARFSRGKETGDEAEIVKKFLERGVFKVMKKEIGHDEIYRRCIFGPGGNIGGDDFGFPVLFFKLIESGAGKAWLKIDKQEATSIPSLRKSAGQDLGEKVGIAATEIRDGFWG